jgi:hypothetical protein
MNRRNFIKSLMAGGALSSSPFAAHAAGDLLAGTGRQPLTLLVQADLAAARELSNHLSAMFTTVGMPHRNATATGDQLRDISALTNQLRRGDGSYLLGVMDTASAVICEELAAAHGAAVMARVNHRLGASETYHYCMAPGLAADLSWAENAEQRFARSAHLYAGLLGYGDIAVPSRLASAIPAVPTHLVSFLIET